MKTLYLITISFLLISSLRSQPFVVVDEPNDSAYKLMLAGEEVEFERPINVFFGAGVTYTRSTLYNPTISPENLYLEFQDQGPFSTSISTGLVWNPFKPKEGKRKILMDLATNKPINYQRCDIAVALLIDVFQLNFDQSDINSTVPLDVGFGAGWRKEDFLVLLTIEFSHHRQPRDYFIRDYKGKCKTLTLPGEEGPTTRLDSTNDALFYDKLVPSIGLRMAYTFLKKEK